MNRRIAQEARTEAAAAMAALGTQPAVVGTPGQQTAAATSFSVVATTTNAGTAVVDTGFKPTSGHAAKVDGGFSVTDRTAHTVYVKNANAALRNYGGLVVAGAPVIGGGNGDAALSTSTIVFGVSGGGTLTVTFTPPGGYVGTLDWLFQLNLLEN